jgi:hypothetical protein
MPNAGSLISPPTACTEATMCVKEILTGGVEHMCDSERIARKRGQLCFFNLPCRLVPFLSCFQSRLPLQKRLSLK